MAWRTCYTATVNGRQIVVRHRTPDPSEYPDQQFLGFDTAHWGMEGYTMADAINATRIMIRDIEKVTHD